MCNIERVFKLTLEEIKMVSEFRVSYSDLKAFLSVVMTSPGSAKLCSYYIRRKSNELIVSWDTLEENIKFIPADIEDMLSYEGFKRFCTVDKRLPQKVICFNEKACEVDDLIALLAFMLDGKNSFVIKYDETEKRYYLNWNFDSTDNTYYLCKILTKMMEKPIK